MTTFVGTQDDIQGFLKAAINLENDAIDAYEEVIERLDDRTASAKISEFLNDHLRHREELSAIANGFGVEVPNGSAKALLTTGKIVLADMFGDDKILKAMVTNENDTVSGYENVLKQSYCTGELRVVCERAYNDEIRHREWMESAATRLKNVA